MSTSKETKYIAVVDENHCCGSGLIKMGIGYIVSDFEAVHVGHRTKMGNFRLPLTFEISIELIKLDTVQ